MGLIRLACELEEHVIQKIWGGELVLGPKNQAKPIFSSLAFRYRFSDLLNDPPFARTHAPSRVCSQSSNAC